MHTTPRVPCAGGVDADRVALAQHSSGPPRVTGVYTGTPTHTRTHEGRLRGARSGIFFHPVGPSVKNKKWVQGKKKAERHFSFSFLLRLPFRPPPSSSRIRFDVERWCGLRTSPDGAVPCGILVSSASFRRASSKCVSAILRTVVTPPS